MPLDAEKFKQAVLNLVINALEAMPEGGDARRWAPARRRRAAGRGHRHRARASRRRSRTRPVQALLLHQGPGDGMGLALTEKLVGQHGGRIDFRTGPRGHDLLASPSPWSRRSRRDGRAMSDAPFRILIVDDEPNIRSGLALALEEESYEVSTAKDGAEAWDLFRRSPTSWSSPT